MSNPYIPDQLHHMSRKLLEFARTAHEENVKLVQQLAKANDEVTTLKRVYNQLFNAMQVEQQLLAKANERVTELESELVSGHNHIQELRQEAGEYAVLIAKANERVKELEGFYATYEREFKALAKWAVSMNNDICEGKYHNNTPEGAIYSENLWVDYRWQDVTDPLFTTHEEALNKFAIEQKIGVLQELADGDENGTKHVYYRCLGKIKQLRKEQE
jgi:chromosome segregation ATPase